MMFTGKPNLPLSTLAAFVELRFGIRGDIESLTGERDQNASIIDKSQGAYVLKVANLGEDMRVLRLQNTAMVVAGRYEVSLRLPRVIRSHEGNDIEFVESSGRRYAVRLLTRMPGITLSRVTGSSALRREVGAHAAHLDKAFSALATIIPRKLPWDIMNALGSRPLLALIDDAAHRRLLNSVLTEGENAVLPELGALPPQWIHNDLNLNNLLVSIETPHQLSGIIDLGDMILAPRLVEVAIAAAHQCAREEEPLGAAVDVISGYHDFNPLTDVEIKLIPRVIALRLTMAVLIQLSHSRTGTTSHFDLAAHEGFLHAISQFSSQGWSICAQRIQNALQLNSR